MTNTYARAYTEVIEILSYFSKEEYNKIPEEKINFYKKHMDKEYIYNINPEIDLSEQNISKEANAILISLFRDYFANEKQKQTLNNLLNQNQRKIEEMKAEKYNPNDIFKKKIDDKDVLINDDMPSQNSLIEIKEPGFIQKIVEKIKKFLHIG